MLMLNLETRKLQQAPKRDKGVGAWWCPLCNKIRRNEVITQIRTCDSTELFIGYFGNSDEYASPKKQGLRTNTDMLAVFFKNGSVFVVAENDLTPTTKRMKQVSMERAVSTLVMLLRLGASADLVSDLPRKQRIALLKRRCTIKQVTALRGWSIENPRQDAVRQWRLIAKSYNQIDLNKVLQKLSKTLNDEFDDDECAQISAAVQLADSEWPNQ